MTAKQVFAVLKSLMQPDSCVTQNDINERLDLHNEDQCAHGDVRQEIADEATARQQEISNEANTRQGQIDVINELIPNQASGNNQLADKNFVNSSVEQSAANRVTHDAAGNPFPSRAHFNNAVSAGSLWHCGALYTPSTKDYCLISADEAAPMPWTGGQTRLEYDGFVWAFAYGINNRPFTASETAAIESGITAVLVSKITELSSQYRALEARVDVLESPTYIIA